MDEKMKISKQVAIKNSIWKVAEGFLSKGISMIVSIVLARILLPDDYGIISFTAIFLNFSDTLIQAGFATALIRKEIISKEDCSTVIGISVLISIFLYVIIFISAPFVAAFYGEPLLTSVLRVISLILFLQAFASVRTAIISREMKFKILLICSIVSNIISGLLGISLAMLGLGVWALVIQQISQQIIVTVSLYFAVHIHIEFKIYRQNAKMLIPFSTKVLISSILSFAGSAISNLIVGKVYSITDLAYCDKGALLPQNIALYTFSAVSSVFLPVFASCQDDYDKLNSIFQRVLNVSFYIIFPMMAGLCLTAEPLISIILTDKWLPSVNIMRWNCLYYAMTPLLLAHVQLHFAIGKSETRIKIEIIRIFIISITMLFAVKARISIVTLSALMAVIQVLVVMVITIESVRNVGIQLNIMFKNFFSTILCTICMCIMVCFVGKIELSNITQLILKIFVGVLFYIITSILFRAKAFYEILSMVQCLKSNDKRFKEGII